MNKYWIERLIDGEWVAEQPIEGRTSAVILPSYDDALNALDAKEIQGVRVQMVVNGRQSVSMEEVR